MFCLLLDGRRRREEKKKREREKAGGDFPRVGQTLLAMPRFTVVRCN
jgi:hypothetical protein